MSKKSNQNALVHGVYVSDIILPWERVEDFNELLEGIRLDFKPNGAIEDNTVFEIAALLWKKRRTNRMLQLAFLQSSFAAEIEKSGKRSVSGIRGFLKTQRVKEKRDEGQFAAAVAKLSEAMTSLVNSENGKKKPSLWKLGKNLRSVMKEIELLRPCIEAGAKTEAENKIFDSAYSLDITSQACEIEARLDALIEKKIKSLIIIREFQRQYGQDSSAKLIEHLPPTAKNVSPKPIVAKAGPIAQTKKSDGANDNWNDDDDDAEDAEDARIEEKYDWDHEYGEMQAEKKRARQARRARKN